MSGQLKITIRSITVEGVLFTQTPSLVEFELAERTEFRLEEDGSITPVPKMIQITADWLRAADSRTLRILTPQRKLILVSHRFDQTWRVSSNSPGIHFHVMIDQGDQLVVIGIFSENSEVQISFQD